MTIAAAPVELHLGTWAAALQVSRDVLRRVLSEAGVQPSGTKSGHPTYAMAPVIGAWSRSLTGGAQDPDSLRPFERHAHYKAENEKRRMMEEAHELVPAIEVQQTVAFLYKVMTQSLDTLPDVLERDVGATPAQLMRMERHINEL